MFKKLYEKIPDLFDVDYLESIDIDELLDSKDEAEFEDEWLRNYNIIKEYSISEEVAEQIQMIQKDVFLKIYEYTEDSELPGYVSDDFELLCKAYAVGYSDPWLTAMAHIYAEREIPCGELTPSTDDYKEAFLAIFED